MRNSDRSIGYFLLLLLAFAAGAIRLDADVPDNAGLDATPRASSLACSPSDAAAGASFCSRGQTLAWTDS
jgi:hypothetical protein